ncbi:tetratricopeptide repeat protein [bacterium]|nr:tetratricopeptide repeat protein [bacterium]
MVLRIALWLCVAWPTMAQIKVVVFPFHNTTQAQKNDWLSHGFAEALNTELAKDTALDVIDRTDVLAEIKSKGWKQADIKDEAKAMAVARSLEANRMVYGVFDVKDSSIKVLTKFFDLRTGVADGKNTYIGEGKFTTNNVYAMYGQITNKALVSFGRKTIDEIGGPTKGAINVDAYEPYIKGILKYDESSTVDDYNKAIEMLTQAATIDTGFALAYAGIAKAYAKIARIQDVSGKLTEKEESYNKALEAGLRAVRIDKRLAVGWTALALTYRELKDRDKLIEAARKAVQIRVSQYDAYDMIADAFSPSFFPQYKNIDSSIFYRKKSVTYNTKFASGFRGLGGDYMDKGDYKNAEQAFQKAVSINPKHAGSRDRLGQIYFAQGDYIKAKDNFSEAIRLDAKTPFGYTHLADVLYMEGKYAEAIAAYDSALHHNPKFAMAHYGLAWTLLSSKQRALRDSVRALAHATQAVEISGQKNAAFLSMLAEAQFANGNKEKAIETIGLARALDSANTDYELAETRYAGKEKSGDYAYAMRRGQMFWKQGRGADGVKEFEEANKLSPKNVHVLLGLARYYDQDKQYKKAFDHYFLARACDWDKKYVKQIQERMNALEKHSK